MDADMKSARRAIDARSRRRDAEYMLDFEVSSRPRADAVLHAIRGFEGFDAELELYSFRRAATGAMPDANAKMGVRHLHLR